MQLFQLETVQQSEEENEKHLRLVKGKGNYKGGFRGGGGGNKGYKHNKQWRRRGYNNNYSSTDGREGKLEKDNRMGEKETLETMALKVR